MTGERDDDWHTEITFLREWSVTGTHREPVE